MLMGDTVLCGCQPIGMDRILLNIAAGERKTILFHRRQLAPDKICCILMTCINTKIHTHLHAAVKCGVLTFSVSFVFDAHTKIHSYPEGSCPASLQDLAQTKA